MMNPKKTLNMNYLNKTSLALFGAAALLLGACADRIAVDGPERNLDAVRTIYGMLRCPASVRGAGTIDLTEGTGSAELVFTLSQGASEGVDIVLKIDPSLLEEYNAAHGTRYLCCPEELVTLEEQGAILIAPGDVRSDPVAVTVRQPADGTPIESYMLPVRAEAVTPGIRIQPDDAGCLLSLRTKQNRPDADKGTGFVTICYIEVNSDNPLNTGEYTMKGSGKPFIDIVNIFAANINYDAENGRPYLHCNDNVQHILDHREQFIAPLQERGIRVSLSVLGNHDAAGIGGLTDAMAVDFAAELKAFVDTYGLDGVDFDDEWSDYKPDGIIWPEPSSARSARLVYECRRLMPDKLITVYDIGHAPSGKVDGIPIGEPIDYAYQPFYGTWSDGTLHKITGMKRSQYGPYALNIRGGCVFHESEMRRLRYEQFSGAPLADPFGVCLLYCLDATDYEEAFDKIGRILYDDGVTWSGRLWRKFATEPEETHANNRTAANSAAGTTERAI